MGGFEVFSITFSIIVLTTVLYNVLTFFSYKDLLRRFSFFKSSRKDYYECGFKPQIQRPIKVSIQFLLICVFFLLYDIELVFLFPLVSGLGFSGFYDFVLLILFLTVLLISLFIDFERHALFWQE